MSDGDFLHDRTETISNRNIVIPISQLQEESINSILEEFITREGTDYGDYEISLQQKVDRLKRQIAQGDVVIVFDSVLESVNLMTKKDYEINNGVKLRSSMKRSSGRLLNFHFPYDKFFPFKHSLNRSSTQSEAVR